MNLKVKSRAVGRPQGRILAHGIDILFQGRYHWRNRPISWALIPRTSILLLLAEVDVHLNCTNTRLTCAVIVSWSSCSNTRMRAILESNAGTRVSIFIVSWVKYPSIRDTVTFGGFFTSQYRPGKPILCNDRSVHETKKTKQFQGRGLKVVISQLPN
jgi:hypothetical protein